MKVQWLKHGTLWAVQETENGGKFTISRKNSKRRLSIRKGGWLVEKVSASGQRFLQQSSMRSWSL